MPFIDAYVAALSLVGTVALAVSVRAAGIEGWVSVLLPDGRVGYVRRW